jgi:hypothetical protein
VIVWNALVGWTSTSAIVTHTHHPEASQCDCCLLSAVAQSSSIAQSRSTSSTSDNHRPSPLLPMSHPPHTLSSIEIERGASQCTLRPSYRQPVVHSTAIPLARTLNIQPRVYRAYLVSLHLAVDLAQVRIGDAFHHLIPLQNPLYTTVGTEMISRH